MNAIRKILDTLVTYWALTFMGASALVLAAAYAFQHIGGYAPCELCFYQRYPYWLALAVGAIAFVVRRRLDLGTRRAAKGFLVILVFLMLLNALMAAFHVGVEQGLWQGPAACSAPLTRGMTLEELGKAILEAPVVSCADPEWMFLGLSMAGYNFLIALVLAAFGVYALKRIG